MPHNQRPNVIRLALLLSAKNGTEIYDKKKKKLKGPLAVKPKWKWSTVKVESSKWEKKIYEMDQKTFKVSLMRGHKVICIF